MMKPRGHVSLVCPIPKFSRHFGVFSMGECISHVSRWTGLHLVDSKISSLKLTAKNAPENGCLEDFFLSFWGPKKPIFRGKIRCLFQGGFLVG